MTNPIVKDPIISKHTGLSIGVVIVLIVASTFTTSKLEAIRLEQQGTRFAVEQLNVKIDAVAKAAEVRAIHAKEMFEAKLQLWMAQLAARNQTIDVPTFGHSEKD